MNNKGYILITSSLGIVTISFNRYLLEAADALDLLDLVQHSGKQIVLEIDTSRQTMESAYDFSSLTGILADQQDLKVLAMEQNLQNAKNKATQLRMLSGDLYQLAERLAPMQRIYLSADPSVFLDLPREVALAQVESNPQWSFSSDKISSIRQTQYTS